MNAQLNDLNTERASLLNNTDLTDAQQSRLSELNDQISSLSQQIAEQPYPNPAPEQQEQAQAVQEREPEPEPVYHAPPSHAADAAAETYQDAVAHDRAEILATTTASERTEEQQAVIDHANAEQNKYEEAVQWGDDRYFAIVDDKNEVQVVPESEYQEWRNDRQQEVFQDVSNTSEIKEACQEYKLDVDELQHDMFHHIDDLKTQPGDHQIEADACRNTILDGMDQKDALKDISYAAEQHPNVDISIPADSQNIVADLQSQMDSMQMQQEQAIDQNRGMEMEMER